MLSDLYASERERERESCVRRLMYLHIIFSNRLNAMLVLANVSIYMCFSGNGNEENKREKKEVYCLQQRLSAGCKRFRWTEWVKKTLYGFKCFQLQRFVDTLVRTVFEDLQS